MQCGFTYMLTNFWSMAMLLPHSIFFNTRGGNLLLCGQCGMHDLTK